MFIGRVGSPWPDEHPWRFHVEPVRWLKGYVSGDQLQLGVATPWFDAVHQWASSGNDTALVFALRSVTAAFDGKTWVSDTTWTARPGNLVEGGVLPFSRGGRPIARTVDSLIVERPAIGQVPR